jgi:tRNA dimethylallyltransferase
VEDSKSPTSNFQLPTSPRPLLVIVGETASGKSALGIELAERFNGEIICADSRTIYKGMDIGTAKPTKEERASAPHHLLDVVAPNTRFTVVDFKRLANDAIANIASRGKMPIMVGGTGLYVDSVIYDYEFSTPKDAMLRDPQNPRHLMKDESRARQEKLRPNTLILGLKLERDTLKERIANRVDAMVESGLVDEVRNLGAEYGWQATALQATGYKAFREYINGAITLDEAKELFIKNDLNLAKRQRTWFKRNKSIHWVKGPAEGVSLAAKWLQAGGSE